MFRIAKSLVPVVAMLVLVGSLAYLVKQSAVYKCSKADSYTYCISNPDKGWDVRLGA
jgi:hypothetical protein